MHSKKTELFCFKLFQIIFSITEYFKYFLTLPRIFAVTPKIKESLDNMIKYVSHALKKL